MLFIAYIVKCIKTYIWQIIIFKGEWIAALLWLEFKQI